MDPDAEKARLLQRDAEWARVAREGRDIDRILSYWTDDAVVLPPAVPTIVGKTALRRYVESSLQMPGFQIRWSSAEVVLSPDGNLAYMFSKNTVTVNGQDGAPATMNGRASTIWRREPDGEWRCAVDIWNAEPEA